MFELVLRYRMLVLLLLVGVVVYGFYSYRTLPIDAFPDPTPVQVNIYTEAPGLSPEEVETLITIPVESVMNGVKDVELVRSVSMPGLSYVSVFFKDGTDVYFARRLVLEKLQDVKENLPEGYVPVMGPNATGLGNVLIYVLRDTTGRYSLEEIKSIYQQWLVRPILMSVGGIEEIVQFGPELAYLIVPDFERFAAYGVTFEEFIEALKRNNLLVEGGFYKTPEGELVVRGLGKVRSVNEILNIPVKVDAERGLAVYVRDVARVVRGEVPNRRGAFTYNEQEMQGNIVVKRIYENTQEVVRKLRQKLKEIQSILPEGLKIERLYDQAYLTEKAVQTVEKALLEGIILVSLAMLVYLGNFRASLLVISSIPLTLLIAFIVMKHYGISGNLMSLGGLAIGLGLFADATVVVVENVYRHLSERKNENKLRVVLDAVREVWRPVFFAILIIAVVFTPIFTFESIEGKYFKPLALTVIFALMASLFVAFVFIPVLSYYLLKGGREEDTLFMRKIKAVYARILELSFRIRGLLVAGTVLAFIVSLFLLTRIGTEFTPELEEGAVLIEAYLDPNISLEESKKIAYAIEKTALEYPEVLYAFSTVGRAEKGEAVDVNYIETWVILKPHDEWETFKTRQEFNDILRKRLAWLPAELEFTQPIKMRIDELLSGVKSDIAVKIFGPDPKVLNELAEKVEKVVKTVKGATDVHKEEQTGRLQLRVEPKRDALARYGLTAEELLNVIRYTLGGAPAGTLQQDTYLFPIHLTLPDEYRNKIKRLGSIPLFERDGKLLTLGQLAELKKTEGLFVIRRENNIRYALVMANVEGRDLGSFVEELRKKIKEQVKLPTGYFITFGGQFESQQRAMKKLTVVVPLAILLIFLLLYLNYNSVRDALVIMLNVPFATIGGIISLYLSGFNLSVPSAIGFIAVFGIATLNGVVLVSYIRQMLQKIKDVTEAVKRAAMLRLRPILITATAASLGLVPMLLSKGIGSEVQKPLAVVVVGGIFTSTLLTLVILPAVYEWTVRRFGR
ncbi:MAG: efflux RND transporter permease subunit [Aquificae bacterium]|nr:efflux RND transporter permease subunit [Aquificota bacterium]